MDSEVEELLGTHTPPVRELTVELLELVRTLVPKARKKVHLGWKNVVYSFDGKMKAAFCAIVPHKAHVNVQLMKGVELSDPDGLLQGTGKAARHVKIRTPEDVETDGLKALIKASAELARPEE